jgi:thiosulfate dehydrogenase [quinone] large subunit
MIPTSNELKWQTGILIALRFLIGWHLLFEGFSKLLHPEWSSYAFLVESKWIFSGIADWITSNQGILNAVDFMNAWGLTAIGLGLILGLLTRWAAFAGTFLLLLYYLFLPPFIGMDTALPQEGYYLIVNKTLIEATVLLLIALTPAAKKFGLDVLLEKGK